MSGIIAFDKSGKKPLYKKKPLEKVDEDAKTLCFLFYVLNVLSFIAAVLLFKYVPIERGNEDWFSFWILFFASIEAVAFFAFTFSARKKCCKTQIVRCSMSKRGCSRLAGVIKILGTIMTTCSILSDAKYPFKIALTMYCLAINFCLLGCLSFAKKFCQCKECLGLKDVKLSYENAKACVAEFNGITSSFLQQALKIPKRKDTRLALQIKDGEMLHEYIGEETIQLHEGEYVVREFTHFLNPIVSGAGKSTNELHKKIDASAPKCTVMTIDE